jgi:ketosteroid isomerase-like protein
VSEVVSQESVELVLRGYRAFLAGDWSSIVEMLDPDVQWAGIDGGPFDLEDREEVLTVLQERLSDGFRIELERCVGVGEQVVVSFRAAGVEADPNDDRPLQTRRYFTVGRYFAVVTLRDGKVVRVEDHPHLNAAYEAVGLEGEEP